MIDFSAVLGGYTRGKFKFSQVSGTLDRLLAKHPEHAEEYLDILHQVHAITPLPAKAFNAFNSKLTNTIRRRVVANDVSGGGGLDFQFSDDGSVQSGEAPAPAVPARPKRPPATRAKPKQAPPPAADDATVLRPVQRRRKKPAPAAAAATRINPDLPPRQRQRPPAPVAEPATVGTGSVIKDRFELVELLGQGGMGMVYKAQDRLKVEAQDRNPYVAVKLLTEDFRQYAESFIALQREASKAQRLAHPNIGTVFDFDRDGDLIYMTMELLEGQELKEYIAALPFGGLSVEEAMPVIEGLGNALSYAHENGLIHSDFKPGNAFVTTGGGVKVIDFGIARASKTRATHGDKTAFDPGSLGGITPAYATPEMFDGKDPHPSDDIYALACITYELLTGKHPYNRVAAPKAREEGMQPAPLKKLTSRQQKGLFKALAFDRSKRTHDIKEFLDHIRPRKSYALPIAAGSIAAAVLLGVLLYQPVQNYFLEQEYELIIATIRDGSPNDIAASLANIRGLEPQAQQAITKATRDQLLAYYQARVDAVVSPADGSYDFPRAAALLAEAGEYYEDSARLSEITASVNKRREQLLKDLKQRMTTHLSSGALLPDDGQDDITDVLSTLENVFPEDPARRAPELVSAYKKQINRAIANDDYQTAARLLAVSAAFDLTDPRLQQLEDRVAAELRLRRRSQQARLAEQRLRAALPSLRSLSTYEQHLPDIAALRASSPNAKLLGDIDAGLEKLFTDTQRRLIARRNWVDAETLLLNHAAAMRFGFLKSQRATLDAAEKRAGTGAQDLGSRDSEYQRHLRALEDLAATAVFDAQWHSAVRAAHRRVVATAPANSQELAGLTTRLVNLYLENIGVALDQGRPVKAETMLEEGLGAFPGQDKLAAEQRRLLEGKRLAEIAENKQIVLDHAQANDVDAAGEVFAVLQRQLPSGDVFVTTTGPQAIGDAYLRLASGKSNEQALGLLQAGLRLAPDYAPLREALGAYVNARDAQLVRSLLANAETLNVVDLKQRLNGLRKNSPESFADTRNELATLLARRIRGLERSNLRQAHALLEQARAVFPDSGPIAQVKLKELPKPSRFAGRGLTDVQAGRLSAATVLYEQALEQEPEHVDTQQLATQLKAKRAQADELYRQATSATNSARYVEAQTLLNRAIESWRDNRDFQAQRDKLNVLVSKRAAGARPCQPSFAGLGRSARAGCQDVVANRQKGPLLVVIPAGGAVSESFAISKYEITESEFDAYCKGSGECTPGGRSGRSPKVSVDVAAAEAYARWLSKESGYEYRLPTHTEWLYAAQSGGREGNTEYNCQLKLNGRLVKGLAILSATSGKPNAWGLVNYVGNVQELVRPASGSVGAAGGSYKDAMSSCSTGLIKRHSGKPDPVTGFRLVRSLG